jgi:DNA-directed RNA polymerase subunit RPC12/RpoP
MGKIVIKCANCGKEWSQEIQKAHSSECECGKHYCAKWREWEWIENEKQSN